MTTDLAVIEQSYNLLQGITEAIAAAPDADTAFDIKARVDAARAWAKTHGQLKSHRLDLLRLEVEALVRVVELGGVDMLSPSDRKAGEWLANKSPEERESALADSGASTTASGMCRAIWREEALTHQSERRQSAGRDWAAGERGTARTLIEDELNRRAGTGQAFEVADVAAEVSWELDPGDDEFLEGVKEMCRSALRRSRTELLDGTIIPRFVTSQLPDGTWVRIPTESASYGDLLANLSMKERQLREDREKFEEFRRFVSRVAEMTDDESELIRDVIARSVEGDPR